MAFDTSGRHAARVRISCMRVRLRTWSRSSSGQAMIVMRSSCRALRRSRTAWAQGDPQYPKCLDGTILGLRDRGAPPMQGRSGGVDGIKVVVFAVAPPLGPVGPVDFQDRELRLGQVPGQARPVGTGSLDPDAGNLTKATQPCQQGPVTGPGGREARRPKNVLPGVNDRRNMQILVGVHPREHHLRRCGPRLGLDPFVRIGHACHVVPSDSTDKQGTAPRVDRTEPPWVCRRLDYKLFMDVPRSASAPKKAGWATSGGPQGRGVLSWWMASNSSGGR
jgi:hypothetical protein